MSGTITPEVAPAVATPAATPAPTSSLAKFQASKAAMQQKFADRKATRIANQKPLPPIPGAQPLTPTSVTTGSTMFHALDNMDRKLKAAGQTADNPLGDVERQKDNYKNTFAEGGAVQAPQKYGRHPAKWAFSNKPKGA